jgi:hypothetical protein
MLKTYQLRLYLKLMNGTTNAWICKEIEFSLD